MEKIFEILIVDDTRENLQVLGSVLEREGYAVRIASGGKQALESISESAPDIVLLDIMMPEMSGYEVCAFLKKDSKTAGIPIIFLTAKTDTNDILRGFETGAVDYIAKPFNSRELLARVKTHLELKHLREKTEKQNEELREMNRQLAELNTVKDKYLSIVSHDMRGCLGGLKQVFELLKFKPDLFSDTSEKGLLQIMGRAVESNYTLLDNLLAWAKSQKEGEEIRKEMTDVGKIVSENCRLFETAAFHKKISLTAEISGSFAAQADKNMIDCVVRNLVNNAVKFTISGGSIVVSVFKKDTDIMVQVKDSGVGITQKRKESLFESREKIQSEPGTLGEKGTGLGLVLCKQIIQQHGGKIGVESTEGKGSVFFFSLPGQGKYM